MSDTEVAYSTLNAPIGTTEHSDGIYTVNQLDAVENLSNVGYLHGHIPIDFESGPIKTVGFITEETLDVGVDVYIYGLFLGSFYGPLRDGLAISLNLKVAKGKIAISLRDLTAFITFDLMMLGQQRDLKHEAKLTSIG